MTPDTGTPPCTSEAPSPPSEFIKHLAYAEASLMLMECLMRMLVDQRVLKREAVIEAVEDVIATKTLMVAENEHAEIANVARGVLSTLANSLAARSGNSLFDEPT